MKFIQKIIDKIRGKKKLQPLAVDWKNKELYVQNIKNSFKNCYGYDLDLKNPKNLEIMNEIAEKLSEEFKMVRVDLYNINGKIYFGELTFTGYGGYYNFQPKEWNQKLGNLLKLKSVMRK